jgi:hypothetical protein
MHLILSRRKDWKPKPKAGEAGAPGEAAAKT